MRIVNTLPALAEALQPYRHPAVVPTMGNLHEGHLDLVRIAKPLGDVQVATIFVNRLQFGPAKTLTPIRATLPPTARSSRPPAATCCLRPPRRRCTRSPRGLRSCRHPNWPMCWKGSFGLASSLAYAQWS